MLNESEFTAIAEGICVMNHVAHEGLEVLSARRGAVTIRVHELERDLILKVAIATLDGVDAAVGSIESEADAVESIPLLRARLRPIGGTFRTDQGEVAYLLRSWTSGSALKRQLRKARQAGELSESLFLATLRLAYGELKIVHDAGWAHGDVQPDHLIATDGTIQLTDFGNAARSGQGTKFRGGLVHFNAPEVCRQILSSGDALITPSGDVYSMAAAIYYATFEELVQGYSPPIDFREALQRGADGPTGDVHRVLSRTFGETLAGQYLSLMAVDAAKRPGSASEAIEVLR